MWIVTFSTHWANSANDIFFSNIYQKTGFDISCRLSPNTKEIIPMKCQTLFSGKNKKIISKFMLKFLPSMLNVNSWNLKKLFINWWQFEILFFFFPENKIWYFCNLFGVDHNVKVKVCKKKKKEEKMKINITDLSSAELSSACKE